jgi:3-deoxy-D-manno-octulosonate 8-phosphate phosphatase (KDO 8-P phosphatase)
MKKQIKYIVMDVDGTLTDGKIYMGNDGEVMKAFNIKDGCGIHDIAIPSGIVPIIITGRSSKILENRCAELGIDSLYQGVSNKIEKLNEILNGEDYNRVAYIGDDINDLPCMLSIKAAGGVVGCPADSAKEVLNIAEFISSANGGEGAVREFIEWLVE